MGGLGTPTSLQRLRSAGTRADGILTALPGHVSNFARGVGRIGPAANSRAESRSRTRTQAGCDIGGAATMGPLTLAPSTPFLLDWL